MDKQYSEEEAQRIFALAAERQQQSVKHEQNEAKLTIKDLEEAGLAAGIDPRFIQEAATELLKPERIPVYKTVLGIPALIRQSKFFPEQKAIPLWDQLVPEVQKTFGKEGELSMLPRVLTWKSEADDKKSPITLIVEQEEEGTRVTLERDKVSLLQGSYIGAGMFMIMALTIIIMRLISGGGSEEWLAGMFFGLASLAIIGVTWVGYTMEGRKELASFKRIITSMPLHHVGEDGERQVQELGTMDYEEIDEDQDTEKQGQSNHKRSRIR